jgi:hypothetical protein
VFGMKRAKNVVTVGLFQPNRILRRILDSYYERTFYFQIRFVVGFCFLISTQPVFSQSLIGRECCERGGGGKILFICLIQGDYKESKHATGGGPSSGLNKSILLLDIVIFLFLGDE